MRKFVHLLFLHFSLLGIIFIPFSFNYLSFQSQLTSFLFEDIIDAIARLLNVSISNSEISSDSTTMYLLVIVLFVMALALTFLVPQFAFWKKNKIEIAAVIPTILVYYLSVVLLKYGLDKIFKTQFYLPEPNTLYTPLGLLDKDILYWSTMGISNSYNIFLGLVEVIPAIFLLFKKTRTFGLFVLTGILLHVVFVNFSFDISVKLYSSFLLFLCLLLLAPAGNALLQFFVYNRTAQLPLISRQHLIHSKVIRISLKVLLILAFFTEALLPYIQNGFQNDDRIPRQELHGAYKIVKFTQANNELLDIKIQPKRLFIHRQNYFIFQYQDDSMEDFRFEIDVSKKEFILTNYDGQSTVINYNYSKELKMLELHFQDSGMTMYAKTLPWQSLPLLQPLYHWSVDEIN